ncbi:hypothetical protein HPB52_010333 [Rhipicephalus sanguineus]|uniref:Uncharacterized protein n=1 Tax=Rhipicephalus sanguineus TaxID=34632 RepID=A0A9D4PDV4_RHISA|nr:hypothetical protein HPB52_010333 [Rhipicephalus sanguineus]
MFALQPFRLDSLLVFQKSDQLSVRSGAIPFGECVGRDLFVVLEELRCPFVYVFNFCDNQGAAEERLPRAAVPVLPKMSMQVTVEGEDITPDECMQSRWTTAFAKRKERLRRAGRRTRHNAEAESAGHALPPTLPPLPRENYRIIVRPRGGLNVKNVSQIKVAHDLASAAQLAPAEIVNDIVRRMHGHTRALSLVTVGGANYELGSYLAAPDNTCKGVVKGVDLDFNDEEITGMIVRPRNPRALEVKRIRNTTTVVVLFDAYRPSMLRCTLYRRQTDVRYACGRLGHRADVCPTPDNAICRGCGIESPTTSVRQNAPCVGALIPRRTGHKKEGAPESKVTSVARKRTSPQQVTIEGTLGDATISFQQPLAGAPTVRIHEPPAPGPTEWANRVKGTASRVRRASSPPPEPSAARMLQLERENASLRNALEQLRPEMDEMKRAGQRQPVQRPLPPVTERAETPMETLMEVPTETPAPRRPAKKRALSQPIQDEGIDELRAE